MRITSYNREELHAKHDELARALDMVFNTPGKLNNRLVTNIYRNYAINSKGKTGQPRRTSLGTLIELLENFGFEIEIKVKTIPTKENLINQIKGV